MIKRLKVGGIEYEVQLKETIELNGSTQYYGVCSNEEATIEIESRHNQQRQHQTFVYEMMHALFHEVGLNQETEQEEELVNRISIMLHQVIKENDLSFLMDKSTQQ